MPCRALEAFRLQGGEVQCQRQRISLNALSGIGGVQTWSGPGPGPWPGLSRLNALSGIGGVQTCPGVV